MRKQRFTPLELKIMRALWERGPISIREIQESITGREQPAYTTIQTTVYRLEMNKAVRRVRKVGNAHIFEAVVSQQCAQRRLLDDVLNLFGGRTQPVMAHLIETGRLTMDDVRQAEETLRRMGERTGEEGKK